MKLAPFFPARDEAREDTAEASRFQRAAFLALLSVNPTVYASSIL